MKNRYNLLDVIRGITIISMIIYHACWDIVYLGLGLDAKFLDQRGAYIWQQSICFTFILLSGFCFSMGSHHIKRAFLSLGGGIVITIVTLIVIPDERDIFGVLYLIGISTLLLCLVDKFLPDKKYINVIGIITVLVLFILTRNVNFGYLGYEKFNLVKLPEALYRGYFMTLLGFKDPYFHSSDYFSVIPWVFLFAVGYFVYRLLSKRLPDWKILKLNIRPFAFMGRHSLLIYLCHQPVVYGILYLVVILQRIR